MQVEGTSGVMLVLCNIIKKTEVKNNKTELWLMFIDYVWESLVERGEPKHLSGCSVSHFTFSGMSLQQNYNENGDDENDDDENGDDVYDD